MTTAFKLPPNSVIQCHAVNSVYSVYKLTYSVFVMVPANILYSVNALTEIYSEYSVIKQFIVTL